MIANWHERYTRTITPFAPQTLTTAFDTITDDLRLNRFGFDLHLYSIERENDDADPRHIRKEGFDFWNEDAHIDQILKPLLGRLRARGEPVVVYANAIFHPNQRKRTPRFSPEDPEEYAEFAVAALEHFREKGVEIDYWVPINEPELNPVWTPVEMAQVVKLLGQRIRSAGFRTRIAAPESWKPQYVSRWLFPLTQTPGAAAYLGEITYHSYDHDPSNRKDAPAINRAVVGQWSRVLRLPSIQTEMGQSDVKDHLRWSGRDFGAGLDMARTIMMDLLYANASGWQMHAIAGVGEIDGNEHIGGVFFMLAKDGKGLARPAHYYALRHFTRYIRPGSVRVSFTPSQHDADVKGVAFLGPSQSLAVILLNDSPEPRQVELANLPLGKYCAEQTTRSKPMPRPFELRVSTGTTPSVELQGESLTTLWLEGGTPASERRDMEKAPLRPRTLHCP